MIRKAAEFRDALSQILTFLNLEVVLLCLLNSMADMVLGCICISPLQFIPVVPDKIF